MKYIVTINDKDYEVEVEKGEAKLLNVAKTAPASAPAPVAAAVAAAPAPAPAPAAVAGAEVIPSPMPGVVVDLKVAVGTVVKKGDTLLILEAMKMENEITATKDGTVAQILTAKGATVTTGTPLVALQ